MKRRGEEKEEVKEDEKVEVEKEESLQTSDTC